jgi:nucleotide-binding universal stress UspA family protein
MKNFQRILVATDLSPASEPAVNEAIAMARGNGTQLVIAFAYQHPSAVQAEAVVPGLYEEWERSLRENARQRLEPLVAKARAEGIEARSLVLTGAPYEAIADAAGEIGADLVVMGTHGRKGVSRFFLGSVASRVISIAPCPVLTVRAA